MVDYFHKHNSEDLLKNVHQPLSIRKFLFTRSIWFGLAVFHVWFLFVVFFISKQMFTKKNYNLNPD